MSSLFLINRNQRAIMLCGCQTANVCVNIFLHKLCVCTLGNPISFLSFKEPALQIHVAGCAQIQGRANRVRDSQSADQ
jgi:hypothetical protein